MKKILLIQFIGLALLISACEEDTFDYRMARPGVEEVDSVYFSTGAKMLIADGQARLDFVVEAFRKVPFTQEDGSRVDSMVNIDLLSLPEGAVNVFREDGNAVGMAFSTTDAEPGEVSFYAQVGDIRSQVKKVILRPKPVLPPHVYVDVIFHVFELNKTHSSYDPLSYQMVKYSMLEEAVKNMNEVFNNQVGHGPNGASANITFRLAARKANGTELAQPGYNLITYDDKVVESKYGFYDPSDFARYMDGKNVDGDVVAASRIWDPQKYLNIVIMPSGANNSMYTNLPKWQMAVASQEPLVGVENVITDRSEAVMDYANACVGVPRTLFFPGYGRKIELYPFVGAFYGLRKTTNPEDWCTDTQHYDTEQYSSLKKTGLDGEKFLANNAMDDERYPSLLNNFTLDQVTRMRRVMEICPGRDNAQQE